jgi:hypothetical protein
MKKLMLTTALASSLLVSGAIAELKFSGALEVTMGSGETPTTGTKTNQGTTIGYENSIAFSGTTKLTNGVEVKVSSNLNNSAVTDQAITFTSGDTSFYIGADQNGGNLDDGDTIPVVANPAEDANKGLAETYNINYGSIHASNAIGLVQKTGMGTISVAYVPKVGSADSSADSSPHVLGRVGSAQAIGFVGDLGVTGLKAVASYSQTDTAGSDSLEINTTRLGASYTSGSVSVGVQMNKTEDSNSGGIFTAGGEYNARSIGAVFAATDAISIGYQYGEVDTNAASSVDEEIQSLTIGYNLGGAVVSLQYTDLENQGGTSGKDGEAVELRIKQAY